MKYPFPVRNSSMPASARKFLAQHIPFGEPHQMLDKFDAIITALDLPRLTFGFDGDQ